MAPRVSIRDFPRLSRFYHIPPSELARTPYAVLQLYADELLILSSEEALLGFMTADMPYNDAGARRKNYRAFERYLDAPEPERIDHTTEAGRAQAEALGIEILPPEVES